MSLYVKVPLDLADRAELEAGLRALGVAFSAAPRGRAITLDGSLECAGEPVQLRIDPAELGLAEDLGFAWDADAGRYDLVCGEPDRPRAERRLLAPLLAEVARARLRAAGEDVALRVDADGTRRLVLGAGGPADDGDV